MEEQIKNSIADAIQSLEKIPVNTVKSVAEQLIMAYKAGNMWILAGNGGSAGDAQHIAAEMVGRFKKDRQALPALALNTNTSSITAIANDFGFNDIFSRQIEALGRPGDVFFGISTSGNSENVINGIKKAKEKGLYTVGLTGYDGGKVGAIVDQHIHIPSNDTARVQEAHILVGHILCDCIETALSDS